MGICCLGSPVDHPTPKTTDHFPSAQITQANSSGSSSLSKNSHFSSAASGDDEKVYRRGASMDAPPCMRIFSFSELKAATRNFRPEELLGEGGFGRVYKGWVDEKGGLSRSTRRFAVAIKKLNSESTQGFDEWESEVHFLGRLSHPNLVRLLGYCWEDEELLLVYEFMQKGSLENHLFGRGSSVQSLPWNMRVKIAIGAAQALVFLHTLDKKVIYRDFKASNILLDESYTAKISDFGLARFGPTNSRSHVTTRTIGTPGYAAPEYVATGHLYVKSDVYGFGVVLIEIMTGLRAVDLNRPSSQYILVDWVKPYLSDQRMLKKIMDPRLDDDYPIKAAFKMAQLALTCIGSEPRLRPPMKDVLETLQIVESLANEKRPTKHRNNTALRGAPRHSR